jgi:nucleoid-associated protein YgaU
MQDLPPSTVEVKMEEAPPPEPAAPESLVHRVGFEGETLSLIAKWYTGSLNNWRELAAANPGIDPNRIFIGNEIVIPAELLVTREPMPRAFIRGN